MIADLDTLLIALYVELTDRIVPSLGLARSGPGQRPEVTDAELACLAVAQVLLRYDDERRWLRAARKQVGHLFPRLLGQSEYNQRLKNAAPLMKATLRWLADHTPATAEMLRLMDATPVPCGQSVITSRRSDLLDGRATATARAIPAVLGQQAAADLYLRGDGDRVQPGQPETGRRTRAGPRHAGTRAG